MASIDDFFGRARAANEKRDRSNMELWEKEKAKRATGSTPKIRELPKTAPKAAPGQPAPPSRIGSTDPSQGQIAHEDQVDVDAVPMIDDNGDEIGAGARSAYGTQRDGGRQPQFDPDDMLEYPDYIDLCQQKHDREEAMRKELAAAEQAKLSDDEILRREVLAELDRSQMPAVCNQDGLLQKTIEHYTFEDGDDTVTVSIKLDDHLFPEASKYVTEDKIRVKTLPTELHVSLVGVPANSKAMEQLAEWKLALSPLWGKVDPPLTSYKLRKGKVVIKIAKIKGQPWKKILRY